MKKVKNWPKLILIRDIKVFIIFDNFYQRFIESFKKITALFISILKMV